MHLLRPGYNRIRPDGLVVNRPTYSKFRLLPLSFALILYILFNSVRCFSLLFNKFGIYVPDPMLDLSFSVSTGAIYDPAAVLDLLIVKLLLKDKFDHNNSAQAAHICVLVRDAFISQSGM